MQRAHLFELRQLRAFVAVAETGGVARAAERLTRSQPAVTRQLQDLETVLGVALFDRTRRSLELTETGEALLEDARALLDGAEQLARRAAAASRGRLGRLAVGFGGAAINGPLGPLLATFRRERPEVALHLVERFDDGELGGMVAAGRLDVAVVRFPGTDARLRREVIGRQRFLAALPEGHPLAGREALELRELAEVPFVLWPRTAAPAAWDAIHGACAEAGFTPDVQQEALSVGGLLALVAAGLGATILAGGYAALQRAGVRQVPLTGGPATPLELVIRADRPPSPVLAAFVALVREAIAEGVLDE